MIVKGKREEFNRLLSIQAVSARPGHGVRSPCPPVIADLLRSESTDMNSMIICLIIFAAMIVLFFNRKLPMAFTSLGVVVALFVTGCVDAETVFAGFGNNNVLTMAACSSWPPACPARRW